MGFVLCVGGGSRRARMGRPGGSLSEAYKADTIDGLKLKVWPSKYNPHLELPGFKEGCE
jgi:hypothetical protein